MRRTILVWIIGLLASGATALATKVSFDQLPGAAQRAVRQHAGQARIEDIDLNTKNGRTFYEVAYKENGQTVELRVAPNGTLTDENGNPLAEGTVTESASAATGQRAAEATTGVEAQAPSPETSAALARLEDPVRRTINAQAGRGSVNLLQTDTTTVPGQTLYKVGFVREGKENQIYVTSTGRLVDEHGMPVLTKTLAPISSAGKVQFREVPNPARWMLQAQTGGARIEDIDRGSWNGMTVYQAAFKENGQNVELQVAENGQVVNPTWQRSWQTRTVAQLSGASKVQIQQAPMVVQNVIRAQAKGAPIEDIDRGMLNGKTVYQAAFKQNGQTVEVQVAEDGTLLGQFPSGQFAAAQTAITLQQLPAAVQQTIQTQTGGANIQTIHTENVNGQTAYNIQFIRNGRPVTLLIGQDGALVGNAPQGTTVASSNIVPLVGSMRIDFTQVPVEVQRILRDQAGTAQIESVVKGQWNGQNVFQAMIRDNGGLTREVQVAENGTILNRPFGAANPQTPGAQTGKVTESTTATATAGVDLMPLTGAATIQMREVPAEVQRILRDQAQGAGIQSVTKGQWNGQNVYQITVNSNGTVRQVQVAENGTILNGPHGKGRLEK